MKSPTNYKQALIYGMPKSGAQSNWSPPKPKQWVHGGMVEVQGVGEKDSVHIGSIPKGVEKNLFPYHIGDYNNAMSAAFSR